MAVPKEQRYTVEEFYAMAGEERCELIDGYIVDMSPAPGITHQRILRKLCIDTSSYIDSQKGKCEPFIASNVKLNDFTTVEPDFFVTCHPENLDDKQHNGAPDWVIEIASPSNFIEDYRRKLRLYMEHGVREYWIVDPNKEQVTVYINDNDHKAFNFYTFADRIPVYIFGDKTPPLDICIGDYLE